MEPAELLLLVSRVLTRLGIPHFVTGSMATIAYGEPRLTNDIDVVVRLSAADGQKLCACFPEDEFYLSREAVTEAIRGNGQFNILHPASGLKIDVMVAESSPFNTSRFSRIRSLPVSDERDVSFASPEDVILKKLEYYEEGGSDKHLRDIAGVVKIMGPDLDREYIEVWAERLGLSGLWADLRDRLKPVRALLNSSHRTSGG